MGKKESIITLWAEPALKIFLWGRQRLRCRQALRIFRFSCVEHPRCFRLGWGVGEKTFHLPPPRQQQRAVTRWQELLPVPLPTCPAAVCSGMLRAFALPPPGSCREAGQQQPSCCPWEPSSLQAAACVSHQQTARCPEWEQSRVGAVPGWLSPCLTPPWVTQLSAQWLLQVQLRIDAMKSKGSAL